MKPCEMLERDGNKARRTWPAVIDSHPGAARWNRNMIGLTGRAECHAMPPQDESAERAETDGGSRKPILVRILRHGRRHSGAKPTSSFGGTSISIPSTRHPPTARHRLSRRLYPKGS